MAESSEQASRPRSGGPGRLGRTAVAERDLDERDPREIEGLSARRGSHHLAGESAPRWSFGVPEPSAPSGAGGSAPDPQPTAGEPRRSSFGPAGRSRSPGGVAVLSTLTLGLYSLFWHHRVNCEMGDFDPRLRVRPGRSTWAVAVPWLLGLGATVAGVALLVAAHRGAPAVARVPGWVGLALLAGVLAVPYLTLLLPFGAVGVAMTLERLRQVQEHIGVPGDVQLQPVREVGRLLIPLVGSLMLQAREQRLLDDVWDWADTAPNRRRRRT
ncbi:MAG: hypothetical protein M3010_09530 [Candidatus Dormibacteraeota bacterium]|nr:hypothetical protein [Candidatus Dormibacteraeota bacterium]